MDVYIVFNDNTTLKRIGDSEIKGSPFFHFIDEGTYKGKKEAYKLKTDWSAVQTPFAIVFDGEKPLKAFYSEVDKDVINSLINYLND